MKEELPYLAIFNIALCTSCPIVNSSRRNNLTCNLPDNCIGLANKFVSYAELEGLLVSYIAWRMKYLQREQHKREIDITNGLAIKVKMS